MATNQELINNFCIQRRRRALLNVPAIRLELQPSPYEPDANGNVFTKRQLDMRRKAEILQYKANSQNQKVNNYRKAERYAQLVNGLYQRRTYSRSSINNILDGETCPNDNMIPTPTWASDVPGPTDYLVLDDTVPLYNYATKSDPYAILPPPVPNPYNIYNSNNVLVPQNDYGTVSTIYYTIQSDMKNSAFVINTPVSIYTYGGIKNLAAYNLKLLFSTQILNAYITLYYNSTAIVSNDPDIVPVYDTPPTVVFTPTTLTYESTSSNSNFTVIQYVGNLTVNNLNIVGSNGYIYDIKITFKYTNTLNVISTVGGVIPGVATDYVTSVTDAAFINITTDNMNSATNCVITSAGAPTSGYLPFSMV